MMARVFVRACTGVNGMPYPGMLEEPAGKEQARLVKQSHVLTEDDEHRLAQIGTGMDRLRYLATTYPYLVPEPVSNTRVEFVRKVVSVNGQPTGA